MMMFILISDVYAGVITDAPPISSYFDAVLMFLLTIIGTLSVIACVVAGMMYMTAGGDPKRVTLAKKALTGSIIGIIMTILSLVIVKTVIQLV